MDLQENKFETKEIQIKSQYNSEKMEKKYFSIRVYCEFKKLYSLKSLVITIIIFLLVILKLKRLEN